VPFSALLAIYTPTIVAGQRPAVPVVALLQDRLDLRLCLGVDGDLYDAASD
jgi:hypothetical protein